MAALHEHDQEALLKAEAAVTRAVNKAVDTLGMYDADALKIRELGQKLELLLVSTARRT